MPLRQSEGARYHARDLLIGVDRQEPATLGQQIEEQLREAILSGVLATGSRLPSSRVLAEDIGVSRGVISRAYAQLAFEGYLHVRHGAVPTVLPVKRFEPGAERFRGLARLRYDLRPHLPDVSGFPRATWLRSVRSSLESAAEADLTYGASAGLWELRAEIASYLRRARGVDVDPDRVVVTSGTTHSISLVSRMLLNRGVEQLAFENPSHFLLREVARAAGQEIVGVPVDEEGIVVSLLGAAKAVVVAPAHQFPTGVVLSSGRREELASWATVADGLIIEDDCDAEFRYERQPVAAFQSLVPERTVYLGSAGKSFLPALRLGWAVLPSELVEDFSSGVFASILQVSGLEQLAFVDFLRRGEFDRHLRRTRAVYRKRRDALVAELGRLLPEVAVTGSAGGLHVVAELPTHDIADSVRGRLLGEEGMAIETVSQHMLPRYGGPAGLLIGFGSTSEPGLELAAQEIARVVAEESEFESIAGDEHIVVREPVDVMLVRVANELPEIQRAWAEFEAEVGLRGRKFYGAFDPITDTYSVCAVVRAGDEPADFGAEFGTLPGGRFVCVRLRGEPPAVYDQICPTAKGIAQRHEPDLTRPTLEYYPRHDVIDVLVPII